MIRWTWIWISWWTAWGQWGQGGWRVSFRTAKVRVRYTSGEIKDPVGLRITWLASTLRGFCFSKVLHHLHLKPRKKERNKRGKNHRGIRNTGCYADIFICMALVILLCPQALRLFDQRNVWTTISSSVISSISAWLPFLLSKS